MKPNEPPKENTTGLLRLFVYGTLKRGYWNHERFCRGVLSVEEAVVWGRLYELPSGIPVLRCPRRTSWPAAPPTRSPTWPHRRA